MDAWYAVNNLMFYIDSLDKVNYCPLKANRLVDDTFGKKNIKILNYWNRANQIYNVVKLSK